MGRVTNLDDLIEAFTDQLMGKVIEPWMQKTGNAMYLEGCGSPNTQTTERGETKHGCDHRRE